MPVRHKPTLLAPQRMKKPVSLNDQRFPTRNSLQTLLSATGVVVARTRLQIKTKKISLKFTCFVSTKHNEKFPLVQDGHTLREIEIEKKTRGEKR